MSDPMFFITYLRRELRRRARQAILIALGLALGVGLVVTVAAASAGVNRAQSAVLRSLYGVGTDVTVTGRSYAASSHPSCAATAANCRVGTGGGVRPSKNEPNLQYGPGGDQICTDGYCANAAGHTFDQLYPPLQNPVSASAVAAVARLRDVAAAAGVLTLVDTQLSFPANSSSQQSAAATTFTVDGVDTGPTSVGPLSAATITSGRSFTAADSDADVAVVDSAYAIGNDLKAGSAITIEQVRFTIIGIVAPQGASPPDVYIPLGRAQAIATAGHSGIGGNLAGKVNLIYVAAASAADIPAVQSEISRLLPGDTVIAPSSLASQVTGTLSDAARLASDLGRWVSVLALIAAFAVASLLTMAAVARRSAEFGTLKALGWRTRRIVVQVLGESLAIGIAGAAAGVGLGFAGAAIIGEAAPRLSAADSSAIGSMQQVIPHGSNGSTVDPVVWRAVSVPLSPSVTIGVIVLAVILAVAGGLLAGALGSWRIARLSPADALARVA
jgi:putative ABC transport system permease protein